MEKLKVGTMQKLRRHISAGTVIYRKNSNGEKEILLLYRNNSETWHLPKGIIKNDDSLAETALRETKEETGLDVKLKGYLGKIDSIASFGEKFFPKETHYFLAEVLGGSTDKMDKEHDKAEFIRISHAISRLDFDTIQEKEGAIVRTALEKLSEE